MNSPEIPGIIYWLIGVSVVFNLGTIFAVLYFTGKVVWWAARIDHRVSETEEEVSELRDMIISRT